MAVRIAILGAGRIGYVHAETIERMRHAELVAIAEPSDKVLTAAVERFSCQARDIDEIAMAQDIDAVIICTPTDTHAELIEQFANAGKAIFCEKPIDLDVKRVEACLKTVKDTKATLMVGFNRRFDPDFMALKAALSQGRVGDVEMLSITSRDPSPPPYDYISRSGGIFRDMTIHDFDMARWLIEEEIATVYATGSVLSDPEFENLGDYDSATVVLKTLSGKHCVISNSRRAIYGYDQRIEVHGSKGMVQAQSTHEANITLATHDGFNAPPLLDFFMTRYRPAYENELNAFVSAVLNQSSPPTTGQDGLKALRLANAAVQSAQSGQAVCLRKSAQ